MTKIFPCEIISWAGLTKLSCILALKIQESGFRPDIVIAIARGGYVPARLLCDFLHLTDLRSFRIAHYASGAEKQPIAKLVDPLCRDLGGKKVLLVDDISDTGDTLQLAKKHLEEHNTGSVRIAVLHHKKISKVVPDFYGQTIVKWRWIIYPWAITEDLTGLIERLSVDVTDTEEIISQLYTCFGLRISSSLLDEVLARKQ